MTFQDALRKLLVDNNMTVNELAEKTGVKQPSISGGWLKTGRISTDKLFTLSKIFNVDAEALLKGRIVMNEKENIKKNIANLLKSKNWSTYDLATKIGVSQPAVQGWLSRGSINKANLAKVAKLFNTTTDNLIGGSSSALSPIPTRRIAVLSWVQAGTWTNMPDNVEYDEYIETDSSISNDCYALRVNGDSMMGSNRTIPEGSIVIVQPCELDFDRLNHKVVIAIEDGDATMKELVLDGSVPYLKPWNPAYSIIKFTEATKIIGRVIRVQYEP